MPTTFSESLSPSHEKLVLSSVSVSLSFFSEVSLRIALLFLLGNVDFLISNALQNQLTLHNAQVLVRQNVSVHFL